MCDVLDARLFPVSNATALATNEVAVRGLPTALMALVWLALDADVSATRRDAAPVGASARGALSAPRCTLAAVAARTARASAAIGSLVVAAAAQLVARDQDRLHGSRMNLRSNRQSRQAMVMYKLTI